MARTTVEDCLAKMPNRYDLIMLASKRAHQLNQMAKPLIDSAVGATEKPTVVALREIAAGLVTADNVDDMAVNRNPVAVANAFMDAETVTEGAEESGDGSENRQGSNLWADAADAIRQDSSQAEAGDS